MRTATRVTLTVLLVAVAVIGWRLWSVPQVPVGSTRAAADLRSALGDAAGNDGYARAEAVRAFAFPEDHGPHPEYRNEWWYLTGNLATPEGRRFGYQLTFFRIALAPGAVASDSRWRTRQVYMAHFAVSDLEAASHHGFERFARAAAGLAGATNPPLRVWLDHWQMQALDPSGFPLRVQASAEGVALDLELVLEKPVVLNGEQGLSRKGAGIGNASYYYSVTRLASDGGIRIGDNDFDVKGTSWLDREWSTSALSEGQAGWDWFALQLDDGRDLMLYRMRRDDGGTDPASAGTLVDREGAVEPLGADDIVFRALDTWTSPATGVSYPLRWELRLPGHDLALRVTPAFEAQEMDVTVRYWEGAITVQGEQGGSPVSGRGYMELAGYVD
jgi:predicted secreted hydrolase